MKLKQILAVSAAVMCTVYNSASACTGVYVGKNMSSDGSVIIARTEDMTSYSSKRFIIHPAAEHEEGELYTDAFGLEIPYPKHTYRYSAIPGSNERGIGKDPYGAAGFNELGVAATATITGYPNESAAAADPFVETGLHEISAADIILSRASSAREGIEIIAAIVDEYGCGEGSIIMTADKNEAWYMEIYTGHQYAAIKLPDDRVAVIPNSFMLGETDVTADGVISSESLITLAEENGFIKKTNGTVNLRLTYSEEAKDSNTVRIWGGQKLLGATVPDDAYKTEYTLLFRPRAKISVKNVMNTLRSRYEGTKYSLDTPGNKYVRAIGTSRQEECHILQIRPDMDKDIGCIEWLCMGNCEFAPFVPYYAAAITDVPYMLKVDSTDYCESSVYWNSRGLSTICAKDRALYGNKVKQFMSEYEDNLINSISQSDARMKTALNKNAMANKLCYNYTYDSFNKQRDMYRQVIRFIAEYEGEDESQENECKFEPVMKAQLDEFVSYTTGLPAIITID